MISVSTQPLFFEKPSESLVFLFLQCKLLWQMATDLFGERFRYYFWCKLGVILVDISSQNCGFPFKQWVLALWISLDLETEWVIVIFYYSGNVNLPVTSFLSISMSQVPL